jgi:hypothetical protein
MGDYPVRFSVDYPGGGRDRASVFFRLLLLIPITIVAGLLPGAGGGWGGGPNFSARFNDTSGRRMLEGFADGLRRLEATGALEPLIVLIVIGLVLVFIWAVGVGHAADGLPMFPAVGTMLLFRKTYPDWWFDWNVGFSRFLSRISVYSALLVDEYPSTYEQQRVRYEIDPPDPGRLNRWLPLVKWLLAIPHYFALGLVGIGALYATFLSWFIILFTGQQPRGFFDLQVAVMAWGKRVAGYASLLVTDRYPPFGLGLGAGLSLVVGTIGVVTVAIVGVLLAMLGYGIAQAIMDRL